MNEDDNLNYICDCRSQFTGKNCEILKERRIILKCDFETVCGDLEYKYSKFPAQSAFKWIRRNKPTTSGGTGPRKAAEGRYFIYTEASKPAQLGDTATMISGYMTSEEESCVSLKYNMNGKDMGSLTAFMEDKAGNRFSVINQVGHQSPLWRSLEINVSSGEYRLVLRGTRGSGYTGDIAVDDIVWRSGSCFGISPENPDEEADK